VAHLLMFATARDAAGRSRDVFEVGTVAELVVAAEQRYGAGFGRVLSGCRVWVNGEDVDPETCVLGERDEVAVIPPVAGG